MIEGNIGDTGQIFGARTRDEADELAVNLRAGSLARSADRIGLNDTVGPSLGSDSIRQGFEAGAAGLGAVATAMVSYYKRSGAHAVLALLLNALILLAVLSYLGAVLTLPGMAGLILTIGMVVDSNVLVFERIREELRAGKASLRGRRRRVPARVRDDRRYARDDSGRVRMLILLRHSGHQRLLRDTGDWPDRERIYRSVRVAIAVRLGVATTSRASFDLA